MNKDLILPDYFDLDFPPPTSDYLVEDATNRILRAGLEAIMTKDRLHTTLTSFPPIKGEEYSVVPLYYRVGDNGRGFVRETYWAVAKKIPRSSSILFMRLTGSGKAKPSKKTIAEASSTTGGVLSYEQFWNQIVSEISTLPKNFKTAFYFADPKLPNAKELYR